MKVYRPVRNGAESRFFYYDFMLDGRRYQGSTKLADRRKAERYTEDLRGKLRLGEVDSEGKPFKKAQAPTLREFRERFVSSVETRSADKPATISFYKSKLARLLEFTPMADTRLDRIDEGLIESFVQHRRKTVGPASVNRELATLRKLLRLAQKWKVIDRVPKFEMLPGEKERDFVLSRAQEATYLATAPQPLKDAALLMLDTGLRVSEILNLEWKDIRTTPAGNSRFGTLFVRSGKSRRAKRTVPLTARASAMLEDRRETAKSSSYVFTNQTGSDRLSLFTLEAQHSRVREALGLHGCVIHSFRHTFGTRYGEADAGAFTIRKIMGHSTVTVSEKYVHPTPEAVERTFERLEAMNQKALTEVKA